MRSAFDPSASLPQGLTGLFERSNVSLTIADFTRPDCPLVGANAAFFEMSGYGADEVIGHNCRFLQPEGGAGPVRARMRRFLKQPDALDGKFLIPNVTKGGEPFLNLVYMAKLQRHGETRLVLGSQFRVGRQIENESDLYDRALHEDLRQLNLLTSENNWVVLGSLDALASSHSIIARIQYE
ncbi:PAS domain-containing protein [Qipengyuania sp. 1NDH17]|uniref:PAS domain-containing protein n=1 Tax=Qipengyuania polymorpha TaxID=2867234 RepID=A0ABS7J0A5_9SPHN|nr:PAS domain-containing protein [Qipengyuania polymorpha]MBX7457886.1 PAS domain-containing protein [Qipengyuania polymorpha]